MSENLGAIVGPWHIRDVPEDLRQAFVNDAKRAMRKPGEHVTAVLARAREAGLWGNGQAIPAPTATTTDHRVANDIAELVSAALQAEAVKNRPMRRLIMVACANRLADHVPLAEADQLLADVARRRPPPPRRLPAPPAEVPPSC